MSAPQQLAPSNTSTRGPDDQETSAREKSLQDLDDLAAGGKDPIITLGSDVQDQDPSSLILDASSDDEHEENYALLIAAPDFLVGPHWSRKSPVDKTKQPEERSSQNDPVDTSQQSPQDQAFPMRQQQQPQGYRKAQICQGKSFHLL